MSAKHTPGPWRVVNGINGLPCAITAPNESPRRKGGIVDITRWNAISLPSSEEGQANARLIAAAPDLLDALKGLVAANDAVEMVLCDGPEVPGFDPLALGRAQAAQGKAEDAARAAIAKAEGRS